MVEIVPVLIVLGVIILGYIFIKFSLSMARGDMDMSVLFGNAGRAGTKRQHSNDEINERKKKKYDRKKKWDKDGKLN